MDKSCGEATKVDKRPSPADFDLYLNWACIQLQLESMVQVTKVYQHEYVSAVVTDRSKRGKSHGKIAHSRIEVATEQEKEDRSGSERTMNQMYDTHIAKVIKVHAIYDLHDNLVEIKFEKNKHLPRVLIKVVGLIVQFQSYLNCITINSGLDQYTVYEICKFLPATQITDLCLDNCHLKEPNYHLLLENANSLKYLSFSRCKIDDATIEMLCSKLIYPLPASKTLSVLNLSSNRITDEGAQYLAIVLRSNRQLSYLNLANNMITDKGTFAILNSLLAFPLTTEDLLTSKARYMKYLHNKNSMIALTIADLRLGDADKKMARRKSIRPSATFKKMKTDASQKSILVEVDSFLIDKAIEIVEKALGDFIDPFSSLNTFVKNDATYCMGNNCLCCLNMSYNNLSYVSLRKIQSVLLYQRLADRTPRGLLSVSVEGNSVPIACKELAQIDDILSLNLMAQFRKLSANKKRPHSKTIR